MGRGTKRMIRVLSQPGDLRAGAQLSAGAVVLELPILLIPYPDALNVLGLVESPDVDQKIALATIQDSQRPNRAGIHPKIGAYTSVAIDRCLANVP
jgi:hypothetical protein